MDKICKYIDKELDELENKVAMGGKLSRADIEDGKNLAKFKMAILTNDRMEEDSDYSNEYGGISNRMLNARGRGSNVRRDSMGRYTSRRGYSYDDGMIDELRTLMESAPDERTKSEFRQFINKLEKM